MLVSKGHLFDRPTPRKILVVSKWSIAQKNLEKEGMLYSHLRTKVSKSDGLRGIHKFNVVMTLRDG